MAAVRKIVALAPLTLASSELSEELRELKGERSLAQQKLLQGLETLASDQEVITVIANNPAFGQVVEGLVEETMNWHKITSKEHAVEPETISEQKRYLSADRVAVTNKPDTTSFHTADLGKIPTFAPLDHTMFNLFKLPLEAVRSIIANTWLRVRAFAGFEEQEVKRSGGLKEILVEGPNKGVAGNPPPEHVSYQRIAICGVVVLMILRYLGITPTLFKITEEDALALRRELAYVFVQNLSAFCKKMATH